jgi:hypothetical protein
MNFFQYKTDIITKTWNLGLFHLNLPGEGGTPLIFRPPTRRKKILYTYYVQINDSKECFKEI